MQVQIFILLLLVIVIGVWVFIRYLRNKDIIEGLGSSGYITASGLAMNDSSNLKCWESPQIEDKGAIFCGTTSKLML